MKTRPAETGSSSASYVRDYGVMQTPGREQLLFPVAGEAERTPAVGFDHPLFSASIGIVA